jgi:hypothetical protein
MLECRYIETQTEKRIDIEDLGRALVWLSAGALLGLAVALPYDRLLGLPGSTGTLLGAAVWGVLLVTLHADRIRGAGDKPSWKLLWDDTRAIECPSSLMHETTH